MNSAQQLFTLSFTASIQQVNLTVGLVCCLDYIVGDCIKVKTEPGDTTDYPQDDHQPADIGMLDISNPPLYI